MEKLRVELTHKKRNDISRKYGALLSVSHEYFHNDIWAVAIVLMDNTNLITAFCEYDWKIEVIEDGE